MSSQPEELAATDEHGEPIPPVGHVRVVYLGPVAPHWEVQSDFGDPEAIEAFRQAAWRRRRSCPRTTRSSVATGSGWCGTRSGRTSPSIGTSGSPRRPR